MSSGDDSASRKRELPRRVPLSTDVLRRVIGGAAQDNRDRADTAVLIQQSIVMPEPTPVAPPPAIVVAEPDISESGIADPAPIESDVMVVEADGPAPEVAGFSDDVLAAQLAALEALPDDDVEDLMRSAPEPVSVAELQGLAEEVLAALPAEGDLAVAATADETDGSDVGDVPAKPEAPLKVFKSAVHTAAEPVEKPIAAKAAAEPVETMADDGIGKLPPMKIAPLGPAPTVDPAADAMAAEAVAKGNDGGSQQAAPGLEPLVGLTVSKNYYERERERNLIGTATTKLASQHGYHSNQWTVGAALDAEKVLDQKKAASVAANKVWAEKVNAKRPAAEIAEAAKNKDAAETELKKAAAVAAVKMLPAGYKPHPRTDLANPWEVEAEARNGLSKAIKSGKTAEIAKAQKAYDAVKLPVGKDAKIGLMDGKFAAAKRTVTAIQMKIDAVDASSRVLNEKLATSQPKLIKALIDHKIKLDNNPHMRDLTYYTREFFKGRTAELMSAYRDTRDADMGVRMNDAYRAELVKDLNAANKDMVRAAAFADVARLSDGEPAKDMAAATAKSAAKYAEWFKSGEALKAAVNNDQDATRAKNAAIAEADKAHDALKGKTADLRKVDAVTSERITMLEQQQNILMKGRANSIENLEKAIKGGEAKIEAGKKKLADTKKLLMAATGIVQQHENWGKTIYNMGRKSTSTTEYAVGDFDKFAAAIQNAAKVAYAFDAAQKEVAAGAKEVAGQKEHHARLVSDYNHLAKQITLAKLGGEKAYQVARAELDNFNKQDVSGTLKKLTDRAAAAKAAEKAAKQKLDVDSMQLAKKEGRRGPLFEHQVGGLRVVVNESFAEHYNAARIAQKAQNDLDAYRGYKDGDAARQKAKLEDLVAKTKVYAEQDKVFTDYHQNAKAKADILKARQEVATTHAAWQNAVEKVKTATAREFETSKTAHAAGLKVKADSFAYKLAVGAKQTLEIRAFNYLEAQKAQLKLKVGTAVGEAKKAVQTQLEASERAQAKVRASASEGADSEVPAIAAKNAPAATADPAVVKAEAAKAEAAKQTANKAALEAMRSTIKMNGPGSATQTKESEKKWSSSEEKSAAKKNNPSPSLPETKKADENRKAMDKAIDKLNEKFGEKSHELALSLARDMADQLVRSQAERTGKVVKVSHEQVLAGEVVRKVSIDGLRTVDTVAQVSIKSQAEAYVSNLGLYGAAEFGLKLEAGAAGAGKANILSGLTVGGSGKVYAVGALDASATGVANMLGVSADVVAKAHARGEVEGMAGFAVGEVIEVKNGGVAIAEASATAKAGGKLGLDGASVKLSAAAEAAARAAFVNNTKLGDLSVTTNAEVWAKARAEAVANFTAGMVKNNLEVSGKIGASAGAGVGVQGTHKFKLFGMEMEATGGVNAGKLGANVAVDVSFKNGVLRWSVDVGAALGIGINFKLSGSVDFVEVIKAATNILANIVQKASPDLANFLRLEALKVIAVNGGQVFK